MNRALLFDLDDTLVVEGAAAAGALEATARFAALRHDIDPDALGIAVRSHARALWCTTPVHTYCLRIGISSTEGLWCRFEGDQGEEKWLHEWAPMYRSKVWSAALAEQGVDDLALAFELAERFAGERRARHEVFGDVAEVLTEMAETHALALVTNGASCLQREKLAASGLGHHFDAVIVSAELGAGKPEGMIFRHALAELGCERESAVMVGDSLHRDVDGAIAAGLDAVWVNRLGRPRPDNRSNLTEIATLRELPAALSALR